MDTFPVRIAAGLIAPAVFPFIWFGIAPYAQHSAAWMPGSPMAGFVLLYMVTFPAFITVGTACSIAIDSAAEKLWTANQGSALMEYVLKFIFYACAGCLAFALFSYAVIGENAALLLSEGLMFAAAASLTYYHTGLIVKWIAVRRRWARCCESIETNRLFLRPLTFKGFKAAREKGYPAGDHVQAYISLLRRHPGLLGWGVWLVERKDTGELIGDAGFKGVPDGTRTVDIGYGFLPQNWGQGYATEAANALIDWAFEHGALRVTAATLRDNTASIGVLRKNGFQLVREDDYFYWQIHLTDRLRRL